MFFFLMHLLSCVKKLSKNKFDKAFDMQFMLELLLIAMETSMWVYCMLVLSNAVYILLADNRVRRKPTLEYQQHQQYVLIFQSWEHEYKLMADCDTLGIVRDCESCPSDQLHLTRSLRYEDDKVVSIAPVQLYLYFCEWWSKLAPYGTAVKRFSKVAFE